MNKMTQNLSGLVLAMSLSGACAQSPTPPSQYPARLVQEGAFDDAQECDAETPCPEGLECIDVHLGQDIQTPLCLDSNTVCQELDCGDGECLLLESYPVQVVCSKPGNEPNDGDEPVSSGS